MRPSNIHLFLQEGEIGLSITVNDVEHVAKLARLELTEDEKERFTGQLNAILAYAEKLNELDTEHVAPTSHVLKVANVMRDDENRPSLTIEKVMKNAPMEEDGQFRVPAVLE
jgi:aspartyl-tRNA(Asn)/glutamyl-tRNA(Gln) amidotransferase subunit C